MVGTVYAVYEAVMKNKPLFERTITVSGDECADKPANYLVRVGTPASYLINRSCSDTSKIGKIIFGGAMMGTAAVNLDAPVTKLTSGILLLNDRDAVKPAETACIRCGKCVDVCPMGLRPFAIASAVKNNDELNELRRLHALDCIECGSCAFTCPAKIPLLDYCKLGKMELRKQTRS